MGWWDCGIMGGDTPMDYRDGIHDMLGLGWDDEPTADQLPDARLREIIQHAETDGWTSHEPWIFWEVLAVVVMKAGADMPADIRADILSAVGDELAMDNWGNRHERLQELRRAVEAYDGTPVTLSEKGLIERIVELVEGEQDGVDTED